MQPQKETKQDFHDTKKSKMEKQIRKINEIMTIIRYTSEINSFQSYLNMASICIKGTHT